MNWLKNLFAKIFRVVPDAFKRAMEWVFDHCSSAMPWIELTADIVVGATPTKIDDAAWAAFKAKYPSFFDGTLKTPEEYKLYALAALTEIIASRFPWLGTSFARLMAQLAYTIKAKEYDAPRVP